MRPRPTPQPSDGWQLAADLVERWLRQPTRADWLLERAGDDAGPDARGTAQRLLFAVLRHHRRIEAELGRWLRAAPRPRLQTVLLLAAAELVDDPNTPAAPVVDHAVARAKALASPAEARVVNAVLRRATPGLRAAPPDPATATAAMLAAYFSHPDWLVDRWLSRWGREATVALLQWNQTPAPIHLRLRPGVTPTPDLEPTVWEGFFRVPPGRWAAARPLLEAGRAYAQDPATRLAIDLADVRPGETVLDLCAAPGGKTLALTDRLGPGGLVVAIDRAGARSRRLAENLARAIASGLPSARIARLEADIAALGPPSLAAAGLPTAFDVVVLDAPCSNTGVLRHRPDVRWRLEPGEPARMAAIQLGLLRAAAALVRPGGRLVYSTCSLEPEENEQVAAAFTAAAPDFDLDAAAAGLPWRDGHDGAGVHRFRRRT